MSDHGGRSSGERPPLHRSYSRWWAVVALAGVVIELLAIHRRGAGDTLSENVWAVMSAWPGAVIYALIGWVFLWHFPWGQGRRLSWPDVLAVTIGLALWLVVRNNTRTP